MHGAKISSQSLDASKDGGANRYWTSTTLSSASTTVASTLGLMAKNRRLFVLPELVAQVKGLIAAHRGEVTAEVTAATTLTEAQTTALAEKLKASVGKDVKIDVTVDESLIGGLVVKVGSRMIDTSIRSKLSALQNVMKEVG